MLTAFLKFSTLRLWAGKENWTMTREAESRIVRIVPFRLALRFTN